jgi:hypothetical protein
MNAGAGILNIPPAADRYLKGDYFTEVSQTLHTKSIPLPIMVKPTKFNSIGQHFAERNDSILVVHQ